MQAINRLLSQNCNCYPHLFRCSTIKIHNFSSTFVETFCCLAFITFQYIVQFSRCNSLLRIESLFCFVKLQFSSFGTFQLVHWEEDYMSRCARHWIVLSLWSQISRSNLLGLEIQRQNWNWWARVGSNHRPYDYQSYALASWATGPFILFWWR